MTRGDYFVNPGIIYGSTHSKIPQPLSRKVWLMHLDDNTGKLGKYFKKLADKYHEDKYNWGKKLLVELSYAQVYCDNNLPKILEMVKQRRELSKTELKFLKKWKSDDPFWIKKAEIEIKFINTKLIPYLNKLIKKPKS